MTQTNTPRIGEDKFMRNKKLQKMKKKKRRKTALCLRIIMNGIRLKKKVLSQSITKMEQWDRQTKVVTNGDLMKQMIRHVLSLKLKFPNILILVKLMSICNLIIWEWTSKSESHNLQFQRTFLLKNQKFRDQQPQVYYNLPCQKHRSQNLKQLIWEYRERWNRELQKENSEILRNSNKLQKKRLKQKARKAWHQLKIMKTKISSLGLQKQILRSRKDLKQRKLNSTKTLNQILTSMRYRLLNDLKTLLN